MKVGIITFHRAINYGAILQAYALKQTMLDLGAEATIIDYRSRLIEKSYYYPIHSWESIKTNIKNLLVWNVQIKRNQAFANFFNKYIFEGEDKIVYNGDSLKKIENMYDIFISGSDQVWNLRCNYGDMAYLLGFVSNKKKKFSYAASFGYVMNEDYKNTIYKKYISEFSFRSVRESIGIEIVTKLLDGNCENTAQHIDPTFLLGLEKWKTLFKPIQDNDNYILIYSLTMPPKMIELAEKISNQYGLKIKIITLNNLFTLRTKHEIIIATPEEFLSYIYHAKYVLTNSFHGTAFAIIFNKKFKVLMNRNPQHDNGRLLDLLKVTGIGNNVVDDDTCNMEFFQIDYIKVNKKICDLRRNSLEYLRWILGGMDETYIREI